MTSLTSFLPHLPNFGLSVPALYERQRALVRLGHLPAPVGRGRGSGAAATPRNVSLLIIAVMATDNLSDTDERIKRLAGAAPDPDVWKDGCDLTGAKTFADAFAQLIASTDLAKRVEAIVVSRSNLAARLWFKTPKQRLTHGTVFGKDLVREFDVTARVSGEMIRYVSQTLREVNS